MDLRKLLQASFTAARTKQGGSGSAQVVHRTRSQVWVEQLATHLQEFLGNDPAIRVLSKHNNAYKADFGLNELLYDVLACRVNKVAAARHGKLLVYIEEALWQIESEFAKNSKQALIDFNKLVLGSGQNKLFVGPQVHDKQAFINTLLPAARACTGNVYIALIPHPSEWERSDYQIDVWECKDGEWEVLK